MNQYRLKRSALKIAFAAAVIWTGVLNLAEAFGAEAPRSRLPVLAWEVRSDWMDVKALGAKGDGVTDDTAAIQEIFDRTPETDTNYEDTLRQRVIYFPAGRYRITKTLELKKSHGMWLVGCGRNTALVWDGQARGTLLWNNGATYARYEGITFDGQGQAAVGVEHKSMHYYETSMRYQSCAFLNFPEHGVLVGGGQEKVATAELWFRNCLFRNCGNGVSFLNFNDYDNTFDACHFEECGVGVNSIRGNFYVRGCRFERNTECDVQQLSPSHASSLRFCVSQGSKRFFRVMRWGHLAMKIQNCLVDGWTATDGAIQLGHRGPTTIFDCTFTRPPSDAAPVQLNNPKELHNLLVASNNRAVGCTNVINAGLNARITEVPKGEFDAVMIDPARPFLDDAPWTCPKVFDVRGDFGAKGDGSSDDTAAIQAALDAAKAHGRGALAYLPGGQYRITRTLRITGGEYGLTGTGFRSMLNWAGAKDGCVIAVHHPQGIVLEHFVVNGAPETTRIHQTADAGPSRIWYDGVYVNGLDQCRTGLWLDRLPQGATVLMGQMIGNIRCTESASATVLCAIHYYSLTLEGEQAPKTGLAGFMFHNDACHNYALEVYDNRDVIVADFYSESNRRYLLAEGQPGQAPGRITIGASKVSALDQEAVTINNYSGRIFIGGGDGWWQAKTEEPVKLMHTGDAPVDLSLVGMMWWQTEPIMQFGPGLRLARTENLLMANDYPAYNEKSLPNVGKPNTPALVAALDDFRELGAAYLWYCYGK